MGLYGSPELRSPDGSGWHTCLRCGNRYQGKFCPECGTEAGEKKPRRVTVGIVLGLLLEGAVLGIAVLFLIEVLK